MIGKHFVEFGAADFAKGVSTSADIADGGFSFETDAVNPLAVPGVLYSPAASVNSDTDTRLTGNLIASCPDMTFTSPSERLYVSDDGKAYRYNGTKLDAAGIALTAAQVWAQGFTDIVTFGGEAYVSSKASLTRWQNDNTIDAGGSWPVTFTTTNVPHPGLVYENNMYWADKNLLLIQSSVGDAVAPTTVLTLSADQMIVALGIDPSSGLMLISTKNALDVSNTISTINKLLWYDGNSAKVSKSAVVEEGITGFQSVGGSVLVGYGFNIGYLSGSGIQFLRKLKNVTASNEELPYKHKMASIGNTFYVLDGKQILAFGEILPGRKVWYPAWSNPVNSNKPTCIANVGSKKLGIAFATTKFYTFNTSSVATADASIVYTNKYNFPRPVFIRSLYVEYADAVANSDNSRSIAYIADSIPFSSSTILTDALYNSSGASVYVFPDITGGIKDIKVRWLQLKYTNSSTLYGLRRIIIYYDVAE